MKVSKNFLIPVVLIVNFSLALSPVGTHGKLRISGTKIIDKRGQPVQLAGMSLFWSLWEGEKFYNRQVVNWLVENWNISVIRACLGIGQYGSYDTDPNAEEPQYNKIKTIVDAAIANGIYVIVDYHAHDANLSIDKAKKFFGRMAKEYADVPNIIWEIWNEPDAKNGSGIVYEDPAKTEAFKQADNWRDIKKYAAEIIPVIRDYSDNIIVVGTPKWCQDVDTAAADPIESPNIAYTLHFYAGQPEHQEPLRTKAQAALDKGVPLFITEFGTSKADGGSDGTIDTEQTKIWLDWADSNQISWVNWSIVDKGEASAALKSGASPTGGWTIENLTPSGKFILQRLKSRPSYDYSDIIPDDGKSLPGIIEAESFITKSNGLVVENTSDVSGGQNLGYTSNGAWAEYSVIVRKDGKYISRVRVSSEQGGTITLKIGGKIVSKFNISSTGGWTNWKTIESSDTFELSKGETKLRVEWSGTASSLVNLNYMEFILVTKEEPKDTISIDTISADTGGVDTGFVDTLSLVNVIPGRIEAEAIKSKHESLVIENCSDTGGGKNFGYTTNGAWAEYDVYITKSGKYTAKIRVAVDNGFGGTLTMKINNVKICEWNVQSTGGWSSWKTIDSCDTFELKEGRAIMRIEWSGTASSLVNLNWIEFVYHSSSEAVINKKIKNNTIAPFSIKKENILLTNTKGVSILKLFTLDGRMIRFLKVDPKDNITIPLPKGIFILEVQYECGNSLTYRVIGSGK